MFVLLNDRHVDATPKDTNMALLMVISTFDGVTVKTSHTFCWNKFAN